MVINLDELGKLGKQEVEFEAIKGIKVKLHTLSMSEQHKALSSISSTSTDPTGQFHDLQRALLVEATELLNDVKETKEDLFKFYSVIQESVFQLIAEKYTELFKQSNDILDTLKKKVN